MGALIGTPVLLLATVPAAVIYGGSKLQGRSARYTAEVSEKEIRHLVRAFSDAKNHPLDQAVLLALVEAELPLDNPKLAPDARAAIEKVLAEGAQLPEDTRETGTKLYEALQAFQPKQFRSCSAAETFLERFRALPTAVQDELRPHLFPQVFKARKPRVALDAPIAAELYELLRPRATPQARLEALADEYAEIVSKRSSLGKAISLGEAKRLIQRIGEFPPEEQADARTLIARKLYTGDSMMKARHALADRWGYQQWRPSALYTRVRFHDPAARELLDAELWKDHLRQVDGFEDGERPAAAQESAPDNLLY
jgi:hypothetical protein